MQYRRLGRTGVDVSVIGFGGMKFPESDEEAANLIRRGVDLGMNYFETSITYCRGRSEVQLGLGLKGLRDDVYVSTKSMLTPYTTGEDIKRNLHESLKKLDMDRVDFYQFHNFRLDSFLQAQGGRYAERGGLSTAVAEGGPLEALNEARDEGLIDHIGFTSHDTPENVIELMKTGEFESVTLYNNILQTRGSPEPAIKYAHDHGIGVVIMGPLGGGILAAPSSELQPLLPETSSSPVELAFRYLLSNPGITTCISGMTKISEVEENARIADNFKPLTKEEMDDIQKLINHYEALSDPFCTYCSYCKPCPQNVDIPQILRLVNFVKVYGLGEWAANRYKQVKAFGWGAERCVECGECIGKCPNNIQIPEQLKESKTILEPTTRS
jgi:predicted aldo/keto reductase-like oxidoreductase